MLLGKHAIVIYTLVGASAVFVGCGGGGSNSSVPGASSASHGQMATATFTITIPNAPAGSSSLTRKPAYVSPNTQSVSITAANNGGAAGAPTTTNLTPSSPGCTSSASAGTTCSVTFSALTGSDVFTVSLYSGLNGGGSLLSTAQTTQTIAATGSNNFSLVTGGVVASVTVSVTNGNNVIPGGYPTTLPVVVTAKDASGAIIIGPGNYNNPITLTDADTSGITKLSTTTVTSPSTTVTLAYAPTDANTGALPGGSTSISGSAGGVPAASITAGTFQYITSTFYGYNVSRTFIGGATATTTTYNTAGVPNPNPSVWNYTMTGVAIAHAAASFNGISNLYDTNEVYTFAQTSPATTVAPEIQTFDFYRGVTLNATGGIRYQYGRVITDANPGTGNSPITGDVPGTATQTTMYPGAPFETDVLPHATTSWSNSSVPYNIAVTGAQVGTASYNTDGMGAYTESFQTPSPFMRSQSGSTGMNFNGSNGYTNTYGTPIPAQSGTGFVIPVTHAQTSPPPGQTPAPTQTYLGADWYPSGNLPAPLYTNTYSESFGPIPSYCNVPSTIGTQAWVDTWTQNLVLIAAPAYDQQIHQQYFIDGIGDVCEAYQDTNTNYNFVTGLISSQTVQQYAVGVQYLGAAPSPTPSPSPSPQPSQSGSATLTNTTRSSGGGHAR